MSLNQKSIHYIDLFITFIALSPCRVKPRMFCSGYQWFLILIGRLTKINKTSTRNLTEPLIILGQFIKLSYFLLSNNQNYNKAYFSVNNKKSSITAMLCV